MRLKLSGAGLILAYAGVAHAQSNVTLYGVIDDGLTYVSNQSGHSAWRMDDSISQGDRFGFKGTEDLGGGLSAQFNLESGFNPNTGASRQGGLLFGRQAWVGLSDSRFGTLKFGRTYDQMTLTLIQYHVGYYVGIYAFDQVDADRISGEWLNNLVTYASPVIGGFKFSAQYSFSSPGVPSTSLGPAYSLGASYDHGPFSIGAAMTSIHGYSINPGGMGMPVFLNTNTGFASTSVVVDRYRTAGIGSSYTFGNLGIAAVYANTRFQTLGHANTLQSINANIHYFILPAVQVTGGYGYSRFTTYNWNEFNLALDYLLSKRTDIITSADYQKANGGARADLVTLPVSGDNKQLVLRIAMRHKF